LNSFFRRDVVKEPFYATGKVATRGIRRLLSLPQKVRRRLARQRIRDFRQRHLKDPAALEDCVRLHEHTETVLGKNALLPDLKQTVQKGDSLRDKQLAAMYRGIELGEWSLTADIIDWLVDFLHQQRPRSVLEFGSGVSTACLCAVLQEIHGPDGFKLLSLEQDPDYEARTKNQLCDLGGGLSCRVVHVPLTPALVDGSPTFFYDIQRMDREHFWWLGKADFVLVDGPFSEGPCRYGTLPQVRAWLAPGARFAMDDALRRKELVAGVLWQKEGIEVQGILTLGQGLMIGVVP
jgi:hypothetical protein